MLKFIKSAKRKDEFPKGLKQVVFVGRSNVGKSSLLNAVYNQKIAYVGKRPGMTKMLNFFEVDERYLVVDVPGYGFANRSKNEIVEFAAMMDDFFSDADSIALVVMIIDCRHKPTQDDIAMIEYLRYHHLKVLVVCNKTDKVSGNELHKNLRMIADNLNIDVKYMIPTSALNKKGINEIKTYIDTCTE